MKIKLRDIAHDAAGTKVMPEMLVSSLMMIKVLK